MEVRAKGEENSTGNKIKEGFRQALREGGARPIVASDKLREIQTNKPYLIYSAFAIVAALLVASFVVGF